MVYGTFDERPELVLADVARREGQYQSIAGQKNPAPKPPKNDPKSIAAREQAQKLLTQARADIRAGQFDAAESKIKQGPPAN